MTPHYCPVEKSSMMISECCNWCGAKEPNRVVVINKRSTRIMWIVIIISLISAFSVTSYFLKF